MLALYFVLAVIIAGGVGLFVAVFGDLPEYQHTFVGRLYRAAEALPGILAAADTRLTGGRLQRVFGRAARRYGGWVVPLFYLSVFTISMAVFFRDTSPQIPHTASHYILYPVLIFTPLISMAATAFTDPGTITEKNYKAAQRRFPYDYAIFPPGKLCRSCRIPKPARSKHCSTCGRCFAMCDHHCVWVNNCIGYYNYRWFMLFLVSNILLFCYGGFVTGEVLARKAEEIASAEHRSFFSWSVWRSAMFYSRENRNTGSLLILCATFSLLVAAFLAEHLRYVYIGATTNETSKWFIIQEAVKDGELYVHVPKNEAEQSRGREEEFSAEAGVEAETSLPQILIVYYCDGSQNRQLAAWERQQIESFGLRKKKVRDIEEIDNIYDHGVWENLRERLFPVPF